MYAALAINKVNSRYDGVMRGRKNGTALFDAAVMVSVTEPEPVTVPGTEHVVFVSVPVTEHVKLTVPAKLATDVTVTEAEAVLPRAMERVAGLAEM